MKETFDIQAINFEFTPDDPLYKDILAFRGEQLEELFQHPTLLNRPDGIASRTYRHSMRVAQDVHDFARFVGLSKNVASNLKFATQLHDIGKMDVALDILDKPDRLTDEEFVEMKKHTNYGAKRINDSGLDHPIIKLSSEIAMYHHEQADGRGYHGLRGDEIPTRVRLVQVCDVFDAVSAKRPYRTSRQQLSIAGVLKNMIDPEGFLYKQVDQPIAQMFVKMKLYLTDTGLSHDEAEELSAFLDKVKK